MRDTDHGEDPHVKSDTEDTILKQSMQVKVAQR